MSVIEEQLDETDLKKRIERHKALVARLVSEGKPAAEANAKLYELSKTLQRARERRRQRHAKSSA
jgi:hypothetical protein